MGVDKQLKLPPIGMGTFGSERYDSETVANSVYTAIKVGYRLFDCAEVYGNEKEIGSVFARAFSENLCKREDLTIISKVWNNHHGKGEIIAACKKSIEDLGVGYIDLYLLHWPFPNYHARGCDINSRNELSRPFFKDEFLEAWHEMEWLKENGFVREIGMSNMTIAKFEAVLGSVNILPYAHEMEIHPSFAQRELLDYCLNKNFKIIGYCPIGSPNRPERDKMPDDVSDMELPSICNIAKKRGVHPALICLKWASQSGIVPIPFATKEKNIITNLQSVEMNDLSQEEMQSIALDNKNCRLVKGHVFLWNGAKDWKDLWDVNGKLAEWTKVENKWIKKGE